MKAFDKFEKLIALLLRGFIKDELKLEIATSIALLSFIVAQFTLGLALFFYATTELLKKLTD